jgi:hypothetical protein
MIFIMMRPWKHAVCSRLLLLLQVHQRWAISLVCCTRRKSENKMEEPRPAAAWDQQVDSPMQRQWHRVRRSKVGGCARARIGLLGQIRFVLDPLTRAKKIAQTSQPNTNMLAQAHSSCSNFPCVTTDCLSCSWCTVLDQLPIDGFWDSCMGWILRSHWHMRLDSRVSVWVLNWYQSTRK